MKPAPHACLPRRDELRFALLRFFSNAFKQFRQSRARAI